MGNYFGSTDRKHGKRAFIGCYLDPSQIERGRGRTKRANLVAKRFVCKTFLVPLGRTKDREIVNGVVIGNKEGTEGEG